MDTLKKLANEYEAQSADLFETYDQILQRYLKTIFDTASPEDVRKAFGALVSAGVLSEWRRTKTEPQLRDVQMKLTEWLSARYRDNILFLFDKLRGKPMSRKEFVRRSRLADVEKSIAEELKRESENE